MKTLYMYKNKVNFILDKLEVKVYRLSLKLL